MSEKNYLIRAEIFYFVSGWAEIAAMWTVPASDLKNPARADLWSKVQTQTGYLE